MEVSVNYLALAAAALFSLIWGSLYYGPIAGKKWMKLANIPNKKPQMDKMIKSMILAFITTMLMAYVLTHIVAYAGYTGWQEGVKAGFWIWLGFIGTSSMGIVLWEGKSWELYILHNIWSSINLMVIGAIVTLWI